MGWSFTPINSWGQTPPAGPQALPQQEKGAGKGPQHGHNLINDSVSRIEIRVKSSLSCSAAHWWRTHPQAAAQTRAPCAPREADKQYFSPNSLHIHQSFQSRIDLGLFSQCHCMEATREWHGGGNAAVLPAAPRAEGRIKLCCREKLIIPLVRQLWQPQTVTIAPWAELVFRKQQCGSPSWALE